MEVGDLIKRRNNGDLALVYVRNGEFYVQWADGTEGYHIESEMEVLDG